MLRGASAVLPSQVPQPGEASLLNPALRDPAEIVAAALEGHDLAARRTLARRPGGRLALVPGGIHDLLPVLPVAVRDEHRDRIAFPQGPLIFSLSKG